MFFLKHEKYEADTYLYDIAVLILAEDVILNRNIQLACLPNYLSGFPDTNSTGYVVGWGQTDFEKYPDLLQNVKITVAPESVCKSLDDNYDNNTQACVGVRVF